MSTLPRARWVLVVWLSVLAVLLAVIGKDARWGGSLTAFLPRSGSTVQRVLVRGLHKGEASRLLLLSIQGGDAKERRAASRALAASLRPHGRQFTQVVNGEQGLARAFKSFLFRNRYLLAPRARWSVAGLRADLKRDLVILESPAGLGADQVLRDPTGAFMAAARPWAHSAGPHSRHGLWVSPHGSSTLLLAETRQSGFAAGPQQRALALIHKAFRRADARGRLHLEVGGTGAVTVAANKAVARIAQILTVIDTALVAAILFFVYRSWRPLAGSLVPLLTGAVVATAATALVFPKVTVTTLGFGTMLIGVAMDYPAYVLLHTRRGEPLRRAAARVSRALGLAAVAMVIGFVTMLVSHLSGLVQLGVFASTGLIAAALAARFLLPALMPSWTQEADLSLWDRRAQAAARRLRALRSGVVVVAFLAGSFLFYRGGRVWDDHLSALSPAPRALMAETGTLAREFGVPGLSSLLVVVAKTRQAALGRSEALVPLLTHLRAEHALAGFDLAARYLPSVATQLRRRKALPSRAVLTKRLALAAQGLPFRLKGFTRFLQAVQRSRHAAPVRLADTPKAIQGKLSALLLTIHRRAVAVVHLTGVRKENEIRQALRRHPVKGVHYVLVKTTVSALLTRYRTALLRHSLIAGVLMALVVALGVRSWREGLRLVLPMTAAMLTACAVLVLLGPGLTLLNVVALLLIAGLGMGYALFLGENGLIEGRRPIAPWICAATTITGFGVMAFAPLELLRSVGLTVSIGAFLALIFTAAWSRTSPDLNSEV